MTTVLWRSPPRRGRRGLGPHRLDREGRAFPRWAVLLLASAATIFGAAFPVVVPSTLDPAFDLTDLQRLGPRLHPG